jgi:HD-GYP domain-containing protein (c-di-GMP phosphodiesterase class II)
MTVLLAAVDAHDSYTGEHSRSVVDLAIRVARHLGLDEHEVQEVEHVALLHDVGKVGIPDGVLLKPGPLTEGEMEVVRCHSIIGARIVGSVAGLSHVAPLIRSGHERWDGTGYPDRLYGAEIPIHSRILAVCDAYDAMTSDRPYRAALTGETARAEISRHVGTQFCPRAASALLAVLETTPVPVG